MKLKMKKTASLLLAAVTAFSMLPMAASAAATEKERNSEAAEESLIVSNKTETCHSLSEEWFGDGESSLCKSLKSEKKGLSLTLDSYFAEREASFTTRTVYTTKGNHAAMSNAVKAESEKRIEGINTLEANVNIKITDAEVTTLYDNDHIIYNKDGSVTVYVYEWTFFDYDDLTDKAQNIDVSGFGVYHKITLVPEGKSYRVQSDEYDASDILGICTMSDSTLREMEMLKPEVEETIVCETEKLAQNNNLMRGSFVESYDPDACAAYADRYWSNPNPDYHCWWSADCTNYASQCIYAGGMPMVYGEPGRADNWFYRSSTDRSCTWTGVEWLRGWMAKNRGELVNASDENIYMGSPVFYNDEHTTICVGYTSAGRPIINSHSGAQYHVLWNYMQRNSTKTVQLTSYRPKPNPFVDVQNGAWYKNAIMWAYSNGYVAGKDPTHFDPNGSLSRSEAIVFIWAAMGKPAHTVTNNPFEDVKPGWYYNAVMWAYENGYAAGKDATHFDPTGDCDRSQMLQFLYAVAGKPSVSINDNHYSDVNTGKWYWKCAVWAYLNNIEMGENGKFNATTPCTRAYAITYLYRLLGKQ